MTRDDIYKAASKELYGCLLNPKLRACLDENNRECFADGAEWRINSVWHDASEMPENKFSLVEYDCPLTGHGYVVVPDPREVIRAITRWAYIEDLLPSKDGDK